MDKLIENVNTATILKIKQAIEKHGLHNSHHEKYAVIFEEYEEAQDSAVEFKSKLQDYWKLVKNNQYGDIETRLDELLILAKNTAAEWIQVAAMCGKTIKGTTDKTMLEKPGLKTKVISCGLDVKAGTKYMTIKFGGYEWRVLDIQNGKTLVISQNIFTHGLYAYKTKESADDITWETSALRKRLNKKLYNRFAPEEQERILETFVINDGNPHYDTSGGNDTVDKIFLLSIDEVNKYFKSKKDRIAYSLHEQYSESVYWWLRNPGKDKYSTVIVDNEGRIKIDGVDNINTPCGVRPAMWLNLT